MSAPYLLRFCLCPRFYDVQIAGTIGTGLFLGSGSALRGAGPLGALLAYGLVGTVAYSYVHLCHRTCLPVITALKVALFHWRNDSLSADLRHFSTLRLAPLN